MFDSALLAEGCGALEVNALNGAVTFASGADAAKPLRAEEVVGSIAGAAITGERASATPAAIDCRSTLEGEPTVVGASLAALVESFGPLAIALVPIPPGDVGAAEARTGCAFAVPAEVEEGTLPVGASDSDRFEVI